jgi:integrase/recombinase XerC
MTAITEAVQDFLMTGQQAGWSQGTVKSYAWHLAALETWLADQQVDAMDQITGRLVRRYGAGISARWQPATCKLAVTAIRSFLKWGADENLCDIGLGKMLKTPKIPETIQRTVTAPEVETLLASCAHLYESGLTAGQSYSVGMRNLALVSLLFDSMLRAAELCGLRVGDVDIEARSVMIRKGKGGADGMAHFSELTAEYLKDWLELRPFVALENCNALFVSVTGNSPGQALTPNGLRAILRAMSKRAGVRPLSPHAFRRGGAVQAVLNGAPTRVVRDMGRWRRLNMVEVYTRGLDGATQHGRYAPMGAVNGNGQHAES